MSRKKIGESVNGVFEDDECVDIKRSKNSEGDEAGNSKQDSGGQSGSLQYSVTFELEFWEKIWALEERLCEDLMKVDYSKDVNIGAVYNPLDYAADVHKNFMRKFLKKAPTVLFLGMNPGLYGMCQTSVPFGHVPFVRDWMKVRGEIRKPNCEIAAKPIEGFNCAREEQSGKRFWSVIQELCGEPENFFRHCFVYNICPLAFLHSTGRNITPPEIKGKAKSLVNEICLNYLSQAIKIFKPEIIISVGGYANDRIKLLNKKNLISASIECKLIPHPSPRAINNQDWVNKAKTWFVDNKIVKYFEVQH